MVVTPRLETFLQAWHAKKPLVVLTAYDAFTASVAESAGVDLLLVGDSLGMVVQGHSSTVGVCLDDMVYHTRCVSRVRKNIPIVADLPFHVCQNPQQALEASRLLLACGADAVKFEGTPSDLALNLLQAGIPVMGHLGLLPQTAAQFKVQGKEKEQANQMIKQALALSQEGCFALVLECIPLGLAKLMNEQVSIPTIGIGAGPYTSGQVLVFHDLLHLNWGHKAKFIPQKYEKVGQLAKTIIQEWAYEVRQRIYPSDKESYH